MWKRGKCEKEALKRGEKHLKERRAIPFNQKVKRRNGGKEEVVSRKKGRRFARSIEQMISVRGKMIPLMCVEVAKQAVFVLELQYQN